MGERGEGRKLISLGGEYQPIEGRKKKENSFVFLKLKYCTLIYACNYCTYPGRFLGRQPRELWWKEKSHVSQCIVTRKSSSPCKFSFFSVVDTSYTAALNRDFLGTEYAASTAICSDDPSSTVINHSTFGFDGSGS